MTDEQREQWSKSRLKCFRSCPFQYKLNYIEHVPPTDKAEITNKGEILHSAFETFYSLYDIQKDMAIILDEALNNEKVNSDFKLKYTKHIRSFLEFNANKLKAYGHESFRPAHTEVLVEAEGWKGFIDRIDVIEDGKKIIIIDYKTKYGNSLEDYIDELLLYAWLYQKKFGKIVTHVGILFTENNNFVTSEVTQDQINENLRELESEREVYQKAIDCKRFPRQRGYWCRYCGFKTYCESGAKP